MKIQGILLGVASAASLAVVYSGCGQVSAEAHAKGGILCDFGDCSSSGGGGGGSSGSGGGSTGGGSSGGSTGSSGGSTGGVVGGGGGSTGTGGGSTGGGGGGGGSTGSTGDDTDAFDSATKDVNLQHSQVQQQAINSQAQSLVSQFGMSFNSAQQVVRLSNRMQELEAIGQLSDQDRMDLADAALGVAGINSGDVNIAVAAKIRSGDGSKLDALIEKGAVNLGMPSSEALRSQILPSLGIQLP